MEYKATDCLIKVNGQVIGRMKSAYVPEKIMKLPETARYVGERSWSGKLKIESMKIYIRKPVLGDTRNRIKFAFLPKRVGVGTIVWFERYLSLQQYQRVIKYHGSGLACSEYEVNKWVETGTSIWMGNRYKICTNR